MITITRRIRGFTTTSPEEKNLKTTRPDQTLTPDDPFNSLFKPFHPVTTFNTSGFARATVGPGLFSTALTLAFLSLATYLIWQTYQTLAIKAVVSPLTAPEILASSNSVNIEPQANLIPTDTKLELSGAYTEKGFNPTQLGQSSQSIGPLSMPRVALPPLDTPL